MRSLQGFFGESFIVHGAIKGNLTVVFVDQGGNIEKGQKTLEWFGPDYGKECNGLVCTVPLTRDNRLVVDFFIDAKQIHSN